MRRASLSAYLDDLPSRIPIAAMDRAHGNVSSREIVKCARPPAVELGVRRAQGPLGSHNDPTRRRAQVNSRPNQRRYLARDS